MENKPMGQWLSDRYKLIVNDYMYVWTTKHGFEYDENMWIGDNIGGICDICDMFVSFEDIRCDVDNELPENVFNEWYWYNLELSELGLDRNVTLKEYANGYRPYSEKDIEKLRKLKSNVKNAEDILEKEISHLILKANNGEKESANSDPCADCVNVKGCITCENHEQKQTLSK